MDNIELLAAVGLQLAMTAELRWTIARQGRRISRVEVAAGLRRAAAVVLACAALVWMTGCDTARAAAEAAGEHIGAHGVPQDGAGWAGVGTAVLLAAAGAYIEGRRQGKRKWRNAQ